MDWQDRIISLYLKISDLYAKTLQYSCERFSNNRNPAFSDEEVMTIYLAGVIEGRTNVKQIYTHAKNYWLNWFPRLPGYAAFIQRINRLDSAFAMLIECYQSELPVDVYGHGKFRLIDSMPIVMGHQGNRFRAKVAPEIADKSGYCAAKKLYYYGVKLHIMGAAQKGSIPIPEYIGISSAGTSDMEAYVQLLPEVLEHDKFADKAYISQYTKENKTYTPIKKEKGQKYLDAADQLYSTAISSIRQPIESFNNWLQEKTGIQKANKVRSTKGLMVHIYAKLAAAFQMILDKF